MADYTSEGLYVPDAIIGAGIADAASAIANTQETVSPVASLPTTGLLWPR